MRENTAVTLKDISKALNVSSTTVHRALNGKEGMNDELREKILQTAKEMGYHLNYAASAIKRKPIRFAIVLPLASEYGAMYYAYFWKGYRKYLEEVQALNIETEEFEIRDEEEQAAVLKRVADAGIEQYQGVLTFSFTRHESVMTQYIRLTAQKITVIVLDDHIKGIDGLYCIPPHEKIIGSLCAEYMSMCAPHEGTILICGGKKGSKVNENMVASFSGYLKEARPNLRIERTNSYERWGTDEISYEEFRSRLVSIPDLAGIYILTSISNEPLVRALKDTGMRSQVRVIGSDLYEDSVKFLQEGYFDVLIYKNAYEKGYFGMSMLVDDVIKNTTPAENHLCSVGLIFKSCLPFYMDLIKL